MNWFVLFNFYEVVLLFVILSLSCYDGNDLREFYPSLRSGVILLLSSYNLIDIYELQYSLRFFAFTQAIVRAINAYSIIFGGVLVSIEK